MGVKKLNINELTPLSGGEGPGVRHIQSIQNRIYEIRGERVMPACSADRLDFDLATLYEVETKVFNQAVKRNAKRFPADLKFRLTREEWYSIRSQIVTTSPKTSNSLSIIETIKHSDTNMRSQIVTASVQKKRNISAPPYAFTEQGVAMLSGVLNSDKAIEMHLAIMRAFVEIRKIILLQHDVREQLRLIKDKLGDHDAQLNQIYDAMENLLDEKASERKWQDRDRVGFKIDKK